MSAPKWKHRPCPCGCGELADECMNPRSNPLGAFEIVEPISRPEPATELGQAVNPGVEAMWRERQAKETP